MTILSKSHFAVRISVLLVLLSLCLMPAVAIRAQDAAPIVDAVAELPSDGTTIVVTPPAEDPGALSPLVLYGIIVVLAILLVGAMVYASSITRFLAQLVPPETASAIYASGVRFGLQVALNQAAQTPSQLDDGFFEEMARLRGLQVTKHVDGTYEVTQNLNHTTPRMPV
jgi:hypothetical protein